MDSRAGSQSLTFPKATTDSSSLVPLQPVFLSNQKREPHFFGRQRWRNALKVAEGLTGSHFLF